MGLETLQALPSIALQSEPGSWLWGLSAHAFSHVPTLIV